jgi:hypothetical protein
MIFLLSFSTLVTFFGAIKNGYFYIFIYNNSNKPQNTQTTQTDTHFLNPNYSRTGRADVQTDQQHSTGRVLIC